MTRKRNVLDTMREWIVSGEWSAGMEIKEAEVLDQLGVSRSPFREALSVLQSEGWIERVPGRGTTVRGVDEGEIRKYLVLRFAVESFVARTLAKMPGYFVSDMRPLIANMRDLAAAKKIKEFVNADYAFHCEMARKAGLEPAIEFLEKFQVRSQLFLADSVRTDPELQAVILEHEQILDAISSNNRQAIEQAIGHHLIQAARRRFPQSVDFLRVLIDDDLSSADGGAEAASLGKAAGKEQSKSSHEKQRVARRG